MIGAQESSRIGKIPCLDMRTNRRIESVSAPRRKHIERTLESTTKVRQSGNRSTIGQMDREPMTNLNIEKEAFSSNEPDRGFTVKAFYLEGPNHGDALVEIYRDSQPYRRFLFPAYRIWNISAHFSDIVTSEIDGNCSGYVLAGWDGIGRGVGW